MRRRARALSGRGKVRYRVHRIREALEDLRAARELSEALGDDALRANVLLEEATALEFANEYVASAKCVEEARPLVDRLGDPQIELRFMAALGRSCFRQGRMSEAADLLEKAARRAREEEDYETQVISHLMLPPVLVAEGRLEEADHWFDEVLKLCTAAEDWLHLGAAYANRAFIWVARKRLDRCMDDLRRAIQLAREVGNPWSEQVATHNVAEFLHWLGDEEEALVFARRVRVLEERFTDRPTPDGTLLLARIQAARGDYDDARRLVDWIAERCPPDESNPIMEAFFSMLQLVLSESEHGLSKDGEVRRRWDDTVAKASGGSFVEELLEVLYWRARVALRGECWDQAEGALKQAEQRLDECPMWRLRFADLMSRSLLRQPTSIPAESRPG